jgi:hypothetical protein
MAIHEKSRNLYRRGSRIYMITLPVFGSMLTSVAFGREHILLGFDSPVLNGLDIPSGCLIPIHWRSPDSAPQF